MTKLSKFLKENWLFLCAFLCCISVFIVFAVLKDEDSMFIDEIYTYGLSNSYYAPFIKYIFPDKNMVDKIILREDFINYLTATPGHTFDFGSVYYNQVNDVHPPLYYMFLHFVCSFFPGVFSKWFGLSINLVCLIVTLIFLYLLCRKLDFGNNLSGLAVALYGLSSIGIETFLFIRMYGMLTMFTVILAYLIACMIKRPKIYLYILIGLDICLGLFTQYYFVFYAFFVCLAYLVYLLIKKEYKVAGFFSLSALFGVGLFFAIFPAVFKHLFGGGLVSGQNALENLGNIKKYLTGFLYYISKVSLGLLTALIFGIISFIILMVFFKKISFYCRDNKESLYSLIIYIPSIISFLIIAVISPVNSTRYIYNLCPLFISLSIYLVYLSLKIDSVINFFRSKITFFTTFFATLGTIVCCVAFIRPAFINSIDAKSNSTIKKYSDAPCLYFDSNFNSPISQDMLQLLNFKSVLVCEEIDTSIIIPYLKSYDTDYFILYVDTNPYWSSGFNSKQILDKLITDLKLDCFMKLFSNGLSETFILYY